MNNHITELNEANFQQEVLQAAEPALVGFWADWSEPCKGMTRLLESLAGDSGVGVKVASVNVEHHETLTEQCGVRAVPTLLIFNQGDLREQLVGRATEQDVCECLERVAYRSNRQLAAGT
jgi:thioredoxin 1